MTESLLFTSWWIPFYGLIGAVLTLPWATVGVRSGGPRPAAYFNILMAVLALVHGLTLLPAVWGRLPLQLEYTWLETQGMRLALELEVSPVTIGAVVVITFLSLCAQIYALGYMEKDWALARFFALLGFFEGAICGLAMSNNLLLSYALLEMLTLSTYLLVGFWYAQPLVVTAARDAFLTKRVGDLLLLMGVVVLANLAPSLNFQDLALWAETADLPPLSATLLGLALIAGPIGKCAQIPLHFWLDEAMEGPNPASIMRNSLVVACGAYVLIKMQPVLALSPWVLGALLVVGTVTAVGASCVALAQIDIKRALSHSTSAYLGLVFVAVGLEQNEVALLLLLTHAVAKALLFMSVGAVILITSTQDVTEMGGLWSRLPATTTAFVVGGAASVSLLPLGTFWASIYASERLWTWAPWAVGVLLLVNGLTALNLTRVYCRVFLGPRQAKTRRAPEIAWPMSVPMLSLSIINILSPVILLQLGLLTSVEGPVPTWVFGGSLMASSLAGCLVGWWITHEKLPTAWVHASFIQTWRVAHDFLAYDLYIEQFYRRTIVVWVAGASSLMSKFDRHLVDGVVNMIGVATIAGGEGLKRSAPGQAQAYLLTILLGVIVVCAYQLTTLLR
ncbi:NAD(P)H-quinone oxidoreductase subunit F [Gloeobacter violaceus]|uniref:NADH dehydrogenase subunit 5 n=1 Tax=Gloeobacter violaceus (strain ATCC 29082 / PCC 7421) TaxID=251221 RepID=Q7NIU9_GLOVI|nr:NAD(P)H-quinone oxidoreductase subunit F [Gloeobacter violaceus]BAC90024.1 NADH dehydrogenase subunit 5 [Gloeobacter violaceus PCC 7421]